MKQLFSRVLRTTVALSAAVAIAMPVTVSNAATMVASPQRQMNNTSYTVKLTYVEDGSNKIGDREVKKDAGIVTGVTYPLGAESNMKYDSELGWNTNIRATINYGSTLTRPNLYVKAVQTVKNGTDMTNGTEYVSVTTKDGVLYIKPKGKPSSEAYFTVIFSAYYDLNNSDFSGLTRSSDFYTASNAAIARIYTQVDFKIGGASGGDNTSAISGCQTPDGSLKNATITLDKENNATLERIDDTDKTVNTLEKDAEVSVVLANGTEYKVVKFEEDCLEGAAFRTFTAKNATKIEDEAFKKCKKCRRFDFSESEIKKIHDGAFAHCKKAKHFLFNIKYMKGVGESAFKGIPKKATFKLKAKNKKQYKKMVKKFKKAGAKKAKFKML